MKVNIEIDWKEKDKAYAMLGAEERVAGARQLREYLRSAVEADKNDEVRKFPYDVLKRIEPLC